MISNSIYRYGINSLIFGESWSDAQWVNKNLKKENNFSYKILARGDAETYLHGIILSDFTIVHS